MTRAELETIAKQVVDAAFEVHQTLGPDFLINFNSGRLKDGTERFAPLLPS